MLHRLRALVRCLLVIALATLAACDEPDREPLNPTEVAQAFDAEALNQLRGHTLIRRHEWGNGPWMGDSAVTRHPAVARGLDSLGGRLYSVGGRYADPDSDLDYIKDHGFVEFAGTGGVGYKVSTVVWAYDCEAFADLWRRWPSEKADIRDPEATCERLGGWLQFPRDWYRGM